jgi:hypothetical protein
MSLAMILDNFYCHVSCHAEETFLRVTGNEVVVESTETKHRKGFQMTLKPGLVFSKAHPLLFPCLTG